MISMLLTYMIVCLTGLWCWWVIMATAEYLNSRSTRRNPWEVR